VQVHFLAERHHFVVVVFLNEMSAPRSDVPVPPLQALSVIGFYLSHDWLAKNYVVFLAPRTTDNPSMLLVSPALTSGLWFAVVTLCNHIVEWRHEMSHDAQPDAMALTTQYDLKLLCVRPTYTSINLRDTLSKCYRMFRDRIAAISRES
jgi:hypothetical protein